MSRYTYETWPDPATKPGHRTTILGKRFPRTSTLTQKPETERTAADLEALDLAEYKRNQRKNRNLRLVLHGGFR